MKKIKVLIVDDYLKNIEALSELIAQDDIEIFSATSAEQALELVINHEFGLALLDVEMPQTNGIDLAKTIRSVRKFKGLPIIFVTARPSDSALIFKGYQAGAVDLLFKPLTPDIVRAKVKMFVELANQRALLQEQVGELQRLRIEADAANLAKSQFLANMSHEIRTPLAAVMGFAELLAGGEVRENEKVQLAEGIKRNGGTLLRLIDDILDLSKIEAKRIELETTEFSLLDLFADVKSIAILKAKDNGVELNWHLPELGSDLFSSDLLRIRQILINLIGNAIKFAPQGKVEVRVEVASASAEKPVQFFVTVEDDGVGLSPEHQQRLFEPFSQGDSSTKRLFGGSGLGLAISREIARAMGGEVRLIRSSLGKGTVFQVQLPLKSTQQRQLSESVDYATDSSSTIGTSFKDKSILVVDDASDNLALINYYLRPLDAKLTLVASGAEAIEKVSKCSFDLILMDIQMPGMDGYETTSKIRAQGFSKPIFALTAHALQNEKEKCLGIGCDAVLTKPISRPQLIENVVNVLRRVSSAPANVQPTEKSHSEPNLDHPISDAQM
jgi:signal transduction histidine kinase